MGAPSAPPVARYGVTEAVSLQRPSRPEDPRVASIEPLWYVFGVARSNAAHDATIARTIRFPAALRDQIAADAERCGRSFEGQVIALLRRHFGEDVDIAPSPGEILALAEAAFAGMSEADRRAVSRRLRERDE